MKSYRRQTRWVSRSCIKNTAHVRYSVRENSTSWRKFDGSADTWLSQAEFRVSCRVPTASPPRWRSAKPAIVRVFYPGTDKLKNITWPQVDFDENVIVLEHADTKTGKGRFLPIYGDMGAWLQK